MVPFISLQCNVYNALGQTVLDRAPNQSPWREEDEWEILKEYRPKSYGQQPNPKEHHAQQITMNPIWNQAKSKNHCMKMGETPTKGWKTCSIITQQKYINSLQHSVIYGTLCFTTKRMLLHGIKLQKIYNARLQSLQYKNISVYIHNLAIMWPCKRKCLEGILYIIKKNGWCLQYLQIRKVKSLFCREYVMNCIWPS